MTLPLPTPALLPLALDPGFAAPGIDGFADVDAAALAAITELYREVLPPKGAILDVMSSWVSHLPPEIHYHRVVGLGTDACTLAENPFLDEWRVQDLNRDPQLDFATGEFDGAAICGAVQHFRRPAEIIREIGRVLKPDAPLVVTFSNRCLCTPATGCWRLFDETGQLGLVARYFAEAGNWTDIRCLDRTPAGDGAPVYAVLARSVGAAGACD
ncbi:MAG: methyltransferase domain-containing protein [Alphaproteobacteria bacterium]|nr:methyltransferase domain-containing protein [Alphaproteobacteria bacterium]MBV9551848.1 methyltransferase domain-containing protein [Alphaproteobacteria bacterium]